MQKFFIDRLATVRAHAIYGLGAAVYTQTTDVKDEINGLMTYDRAMIKVKDEAEIKKYVDRLYPSESIANIIFSTGMKCYYLKAFFHFNFKNLNCTKKFKLNKSINTR